MSNDPRHGLPECQGLPDSTQARLEAVRRLTETVVTARDHARIEDFGSLVYALRSAISQVSAIQQFDRALVQLLLDSERTDAVELISRRDSGGPVVDSLDELPF